MTRRVHSVAYDASLSGNSESAPKNVLGIQVLRGVAAMLVVFSHTVAQLFRFQPDSVLMGNLVTMGSSGVDIFFVISGFVIFYTQFARHHSRWLTSGQFMRRRCWRIFPLYWITITAMIALAALGFFSSVKLSLYNVLLSILLVPTENTVLPISWTLSYEMYFYGIFAIALLANNPRGSLIGVTIVIVVPVTLRVALPESNYWSFFFGAHGPGSFLSDNVVLEFCAGMALGYLYLSKMSLVPAYLMLPAFVYLFVSPWILRHELAYPPEWQSFKWGAAATLIVAASISLQRLQTLGSLILSLLGDASYSIYLMHVFVTGTFHYLLEHTVVHNFYRIPMIMFVCIASALLGTGVHLTVEKPILKFMRPTKMKS